MDIEKVFGAIKSFVTEINTLYGAHYKPLALYGRLVERTNLTHPIPVTKHINAFKKFMVSNRNAIYNMNEQEFKPHKIQYNDNVYFNMKTIMNMADPDTQQVIWQHLLVLSALLDDQSKAKQRIKENQLGAASTVPAGVDPMLSGIMNMVSSVMMDGGGGAGGAGGLGGALGALSGGPGAGSMGDISQVFGQIMSSGILPKMMSSISSSVKDGQIDIGNIVQSVQSLAKECDLDLPPIQDGDEEVDKVLDMFSGLGLDKSQMKEMVNVFQQHVTIDDDTSSGSHVHTEKDTTIISIPVVVEEHEAVAPSEDVASSPEEPATSVDEPATPSEEELVNNDTPDAEHDAVKYECKDGVCYLK
jgi:hypothetical protein